MTDSDYQRIESAICYLEEHALDQPVLNEIATHIGLSPFHFQKLFKRWAGVSPKRFLQYLTVKHAKSLLRESASILDASYEVGLSGPSRLHDLFVSVDAVTPGEFKSFGDSLEIRYAFHETPFGECLVAETRRGLCQLGFINKNERDVHLERLYISWKKAKIIDDQQAGHNALEKIFSRRTAGSGQIDVLLQGTNFQLKVWQALLKIPEGSVISYGDLAAYIGHPNAHRAVGTAVGQNPVAYLIPCHRVLRSNGEIGGYRWGTTRKRAMLAMEFGL